MKIVLVALNSQYFHTNLAIRCIKEYCERENPNLDVALMEFTINQNIDSVLSEIMRNPFEVIGFSCYIFNVEIILKLSSAVRKLKPRCKIVLGGPEASYRADDLLKNCPFIDYVIRGEGELSASRLFTHLNNGSQEGCLHEVPSLSLRNGDTVVETPSAKPLDDTVCPYHYTEKEIDSLEHKIIYFESSRGCPYGCSYCLSSIDRTLRFYNLDDVLSQISLFLKCNVKQVKFVDRTFNCHKERTLKIWRYILRHDNGVTNFHFEISADLLSEDQIECLRMMRPGLVQLEIGIQTTNRLALSAINRQTDWRVSTQNIAAILKQGNVHVHLDLIAGLPLESYASFGCSFNDVYSFHPHQLQLGFLKVLPGSPLKDETDRYGIHYRGYPPYEVLETNDIFYQELIKLKQIAFLVDKIYNSGRYRFCLSVMEKLWVKPFEFFEKLADFAREKNAEAEFDLSGKYGLYELLLRFTERYYSDQPKKIAQAAKLDIFSRERARILPHFLNQHITKQHCELISDMLVKLPAGHKAESCHIEALDREGEFIVFDYSKRDLFGNAETFIINRRTNGEVTFSFDTGLI